MAEILRQAYSSVVPYSCIPARFTEPLTLESTGEYTLDKSQFPGLLDEEHARQPALIIAPPDSATHNRNPGTEIPFQHQQTNHGTQAFTNLLPSSVSRENPQFPEIPRLPLAAVTGHSTNLPPHTNMSTSSHCGKSISSDLTKAREDLLTLLSGRCMF